MTEISTDDGFPDYESYFSFENTTAFLSDLHIKICSFLINIICFLFPEVIKYCLENNLGSNIYS